MKLIKLQDGDAIENGVWTQLMSPGTTEPLFRDAEKTLPCRVKIRSDKSKIFRQATFRQQQANQQKMARMKLKDRAAFQEEAFQEQRPRWFAILLVSTENCDAEKPGIVNPTEEEAVAIAEESENQWLVDQVLTFGMSDQNFGIDAGNGEDAASEPPREKAASKTK